MGTIQEDVAGDVGSVPRCATCGSERVVKDAWACWNPASGLWELESVYDDAHCHQCEHSTKLTWSRNDEITHQRIRELNDLFRTKGLGNGTVLVTSGVQAAGSDFVIAAVEAVRSFNEFGSDNDPWGEHDFGAIELEGQKIFFKIDYYANGDFSAGSENPANEGMTHRVLTIMIASEY